MKLDLLAFGAHPDDVEMSCSGVLCLEKANGKKVGVIDLTQGELGTRGSASTRYEEAAESAKIMGLDVRENLQLPDGFFVNDQPTQLKIIEVIRKYQPEIIICNSIEDRHPDHGRAATLVEEAAFLSGLQKIETSFEGKTQESWRPKFVLHYIQDRELDPDFLIDVSSVYEKKIAALKAYKTQFHNPAIEGPETYISKPGFLDLLFARDKISGKKIGVDYAEGFITRKKIGLKSLDAII